MLRALEVLILFASLQGVFGWDGSAAVIKRATESKAEKKRQKALNLDYANDTLIVLGCLVAVAILYNCFAVGTRHLRQKSALKDETQTSYMRQSRYVSSFKKHVLYAPIYKLRHNKEFLITPSISFGTLPTRLASFLIISYIAVNIAFCFAQIDYPSGFATSAKLIRNRSGIVASANMIPLFVMAARNNPLIRWLDLSFDTFNLLHRWIGRIVIFDYVAYEVVSNKRDDLIEKLTTDEFYIFGLLAGAGMVSIAIQSWSPIRHFHYESFKIMHILLAIVVVVGTWYHLKLKDYIQIRYVEAIIAIWGLERVARVLILVYRNYGNGKSNALVEPLDGDCLRVTVQIARPWTFKPGQHAYIYMPSISLMQSHPFSVAWADQPDYSKEKGPATDHKDPQAMQGSRLSFLMKIRTGFTHNLARRALEEASGKLFTTCYLEGPYAGTTNLLTSYGTVVLFAGGVGITHQIPHVKDLLEGSASNLAAVKRILLVWVVQKPEHIGWIQPWLSTALALPRAQEPLRVLIFISQPYSSPEVPSQSGVQVFPGRPNITTLLDNEIEHRIGAVGVSVCGPGSLSDEVRFAARLRQHEANIDFIEESFTW